MKLVLIAGSLLFFQIVANAAEITFKQDIVLGSKVLSSVERGFDDSNCILSVNSFQQDKGASKGGIASADALTLTGDMVVLKAGTVLKGDVYFQSFDRQSADDWPQNNKTFHSGFMLVGNSGKSRISLVAKCSAGEDVKSLQETLVLMKDVISLQE